jgi:hypothetical protein
MRARLPTVKFSYLHRRAFPDARTLIAAKPPLDHVNNLQWTALLESISCSCAERTPRRKRFLSCN